MTTTTTSDPAAEPAPYQLSAPRKAPRKGIPTRGLVLLTGLPKSGKNTIALSKPGLCLIETELLGAEHLDGWVEEVGDLNTFRQAFKAAVDHPDCSAIGVSTTDKLIGWWQQEIMERYQVESMHAEVEGVNLWQELRKSVEGFVHYTKTCGKLVVALAHYKEPKLDKNGNLVITNNIDAPGKLGGYLCAEADLIGACSKEKIGKAMQFKISFIGGGQIGAFGGRVKELEGKEIVLPDSQQWAAIEAACVEDAKKPAATPAKTETKPAAKAKGAK